MKNHFTPALTTASIWWSQSYQQPVGDLMDFLPLQLLDGRSDFLNRARDTTLIQTPPPRNGLFVPRNFRRLVKETFRRIAAEVARLKLKKLKIGNRKWNRAS
jgi:hypothetical protein